MRKIAVVLAALAIILGLGGISGVKAADVQPAYTYVDLGALGGNNAYSFLSTLNSAGMAVGESQTIDPNIAHAFLWTKSPMSDLGGLTKLKNGTAAKLDRSNAWGIDANGKTVVGEAWNADYESDGPNPMIRAFLWQQSTGVMTDLGALGGNNSNAYWCNDNGWVVGTAETSTPGIYHAFYCTSKKVLIDIDKRSGKQSAAWAINNWYQVVGQAETATRGIFQGFLWQRGTTMKFLAPLPGGKTSAAYGLNYIQICGVSENAAGINRAVVWQIYKSGIVDLGDLGGTSSYAWGINDWGQVVGTSETRTPGEYRAFLWTSLAGVQDLNNMVTLPTGITLTTASSVNNNGQILAEAQDPGGMAHVFLLSPIQSNTTPVMPQ